MAVKIYGPALFQLENKADITSFVERIMGYLKKHFKDEVHLEVSVPSNLQTAIRYELNNRNCGNIVFSSDGKPYVTIIGNPFAAANHSALVEQDVDTIIKYAEVTMADDFTFRTTINPDLQNRVAQALLERGFLAVEFVSDGRESVVILQGNPFAARNRAEAVDRYAARINEALLVHRMKNNQVRISLDIPATMADELKTRILAAGWKTVTYEEGDGYDPGTVILTAF